MDEIFFYGSEWWAELREKLANHFRKNETVLDLECSSVDLPHHQVPTDGTNVFLKNASTRSVSSRGIDSKYYER